MRIKVERTDNGGYRITKAKGNISILDIEMALLDVPAISEGKTFVLFVKPFQCAGWEDDNQDVIRTVEIFSTDKEEACPVCGDTRYYDGFGDGYEEGHKAGY
jgi:hypothetical protein